MHALSEFLCRAWFADPEVDRVVQMTTPRLDLGL